MVANIVYFAPYCNHKTPHFIKSDSLVYSESKDDGLLIDFAWAEYATWVIGLVRGVRVVLALDGDAGVVLIDVSVLACRAA